jgi:hypothetical protein
LVSVPEVQQVTFSRERNVLKLNGPMRGLILDPGVAFLPSREHDCVDDLYRAVEPLLRLCLGFATRRNCTGRRH